MADGFFQRRHFDRRQRSFESFVAHLQAGAIDGLLQRVAGENAEGVRYARFLRRLSDAARDFIDDDVVVGRGASQQAAEANNGVIFSGFRQRAGRGRNFEGAGNTNDLDVLLFRTRTQKGVVRTSQQSVSDELVESRDNNGKTSTHAVQPARERVPGESFF